MRLNTEAASLLRTAARQSSTPVYLVGGAIRDLWLGRPTHDLDVATQDAHTLAARLARTFKATLVTLDADNAIYRVALPLKSAAQQTVRQIDVAGLQGADILQDLARRDFTINALALPLTPALSTSVPDAALLDPRSGLADLRKKIIRAERDSLFTDDPLRLLRAFRIAAQLDFIIEPQTVKMLRRLRDRVRTPAAERIGAELMALLAVDGASCWVRQMDETGILTALFKELEPARRCAVVYYGAGGVLKHSLDTVAREDMLLSKLNRVFGALAPKITEHLDQRSTPTASYRATLMLAALLHDVSKAETAKKVGGRLRFFGHDLIGAKRVSQMLTALKCPSAQIASIAAIVAHHLRPGNLAGAGELTDKAAYRFFRDLGEHAVGLLLVCWADHASYIAPEKLSRALAIARSEPGRRVSSLPEIDRKTIHHLQVVTHLLRRYFDTQRAPLPPRLINGNEVMKILRLKPGPQIGEILEKVRETQAEGLIKTREQAFAYLKRLKI